MTYIIYCDESEHRGTFYSDFYGGALIEAEHRESLESVLRDAKSAPEKEMKWTDIGPHNEEHYRRFMDAFFDKVRDGFIKVRIMFTQNINQVPKGTFQKDETFFRLYYQFVKHAFGLRYCNPASIINRDIIVYLDDVPDTRAKFDRFRDYMSTLSEYSVFRTARVRIRREDIADVDSKKHVVLQAVDVVLGAVQFRLNEKHRYTEEGKRRRGKRTRAKEKVYKHINKRIREIYPGFNVGVSTGQLDGPHVRWTHPYRHWCFVPNASTRDLSRGKGKKG